MVDIFFVISGYVLSYRIIKLMRTQQAEPFLHSVVSSIFRRFTRLYGSAAIASFIMMTLVFFGWTTPNMIKNLQKSTFSTQVWDWAKDYVHYSNIFAANIQGFWYKGSLNNKYLLPLWTIPVEYRGSIVVFAL